MRGQKQGNSCIKRMTNQFEHRERNKKLVALSRNLRKGMTKEERHLWYDFFVNLPFTIKRQSVIGNYIVDFYCPTKSIVIELDGGQHYEDNGMQHDKIRDNYLLDNGLTVLRYTNDDIHKRFESVCADIWNHMVEDM